MIPLESQVPAVLDLLGISHRKSGRWCTAPCPVHGGDNATGFAVRNDGRWQCFTHHCEKEWGSSLASLVAAVLKINYHEALAWLEENVGIFENESKQKEKEDRIFPDVCLKRLFRTDFYTKRGFRQETVDAFEHGLAESHEMRNRIVFPIRDDLGKIRGFSGRWAGVEKEIDGKKVCLTDGGKQVGKWRHTSFQKAKYLYNFYRAKDFCRDELIVVESIGNVMRWWEAGFKNCVACLGSRISSQQAQLIIRATCKVILAFDNDAAGEKAYKTSKKILEQFVNVEHLIPTKNDWADMTTQEVVAIHG